MINDSNYITRGLHTFIESKQASIITSKLAAETFAVKYNQLADQYFLEKTEDFTLSGKIYGEATRYADRIFNTFCSRSQSTGVLLEGEKGSGKTMLSKKLSIMGYAAGIPTILVNEPFRGTTFNQFIGSISQPAIVIFDEFEKVYDRDEQQELLTLMDGLVTTKKLFILTANDSWAVSRHMINRPGRIFYSIKYAGLSPSTIREYCNDVLVNKEYIEPVVAASLLFAEFNFDMLKAIVEEMNRYNSDVASAMEILNARPESYDEYDETRWEGTITVEGIEYAANVNGDPFNDNSFQVRYLNPHPSDDSKYLRVEYTYKDMQPANTRTGTLTFINAKGDKLVIKKRTVQTMFGSGATSTILGGYTHE